MFDDRQTLNYWQKIRLYASFQQFLYRLREEIRKMLDIPEEHIILEKQKRIISPDLQAFEYMGNNSLDIKPSPNAYDIIFDK
jgi:hypothetical protein